MVDIANGISSAADERWDGLQRQLGLPQAGSFGLVTVHRASNTEPNALDDLIALLSAVEIPLVLPLHPRTQAALERSGAHVALSEIPGLTILPPLGYVDLAAVVRKAQVVLTDSGGLQKEAYAHSIPCITLRDTTEWTETVDLGWNTIVGLNAGRAREAVQAYAANPPKRPAAAQEPYGAGNAAEQIVELLITPHARTHETA
jgi:UDP-N-acetylglucosamine 2-epimerase